jgi:hypothetical protein
MTITNMGAGPCTLEGYPTLALVPASGTVTPVFSMTGPAPLAVGLAAKGEAGFAVEYSDEQVNGQTSCPQIADIDIKLPNVVGAAAHVPARFFPCGAPNIAVTAVLSLSQYEAIVH